MCQEQRCSSPGRPGEGEAASGAGEQGDPGRDSRDSRRPHPGRGGHRRRRHRMGAEGRSQQPRRAPPRCVRVPDRASLERTTVLGGALGGTLFFPANDGIHGQELWKSDGTHAGTVLVKDINPVTTPTRSSDHRCGRDVVLQRRRRHARQELWKSDGTRAGTVLVKDIRPGPLRHSGPRSLTDVGGTLFFTADDGIHGTSCGSPTAPSGHGPGQGHRPRSRLLRAVPVHLTGVKGTVFFTRRHGAHGASCGSRMAAGRARSWSRTSTQAPTTQRPGRPDRCGGTLFFSADDASTAAELWKSDGTEAGTVLVKDIDPRRLLPAPSSLTKVRGRVVVCRRRRHPRA